MDKEFNIVNLLQPGFSGAAIRKIRTASFSHYQLVVVELYGLPTVLMFTPTEFLTCMTPIPSDTSDVSTFGTLSKVGSRYVGKVMFNGIAYKFSCTTTVFAERVSYRWLHIEPSNWTILTNCEEHPKDEDLENSRFSCNKLNLNTGEHRTINFNHHHRKSVFEFDLRAATCKPMCGFKGLPIINKLSQLINNILSYIDRFTPLRSTPEKQLSSVSLAEWCFRLKAS